MFVVWLSGHCIE